MSALRVYVQGIGLLGPGLASWSAARDILGGAQPHANLPTVLPLPARLPPAERRRAGAAVKLALAVADQAVLQADVDPSVLATVFASSSGEGSNCHLLCETLATPAPMVSPTRFTNSVHNAAAGCWHIAVASRAASTSLAAYDGSFGAGLIEAMTSAHVDHAPILLVASDTPYPEPLHATRPLPDDFGTALLLAPAPDARTLAELTLTLHPSERAVSVRDDASLDAQLRAVTPCADASLDALRRAIPAARALPLLVALAQPRAPRRIVIEAQAGLLLQIDLA